MTEPKKISALDSASKNALKAVVNESIEISGINTPLYVFALQNDSATYYTREYLQKLYLEGVLYPKAPISINSNKCANIFRQSANATLKEDTDLSFVFSGNGYTSQTKTIKLVRTKISNAKTKKIIVMSVGDSLSAQNRYETPGDSSSNAYSIIGAIKEMSLKDNIDFGTNDIEIITVGTYVSADLSESYKGNNLNFKAFNESVASSSCADFLRHCTLVSTAGATTTKYQIGGDAAWCSLGLQTVNGVYTGSTAQKELMRTTCHTKYAPDYTQSLWIWMKSAYPLIITESEYNVGDTTQMQACFAEMIDNPVIPFFDKNMIISTSGAYSFSLATYLHRYKTLDSTGKVRLNVGTTAGSKVTDINAFDVCVPTHVIMQFGTNDNAQYNASHASVISDLNLLASRFISEGVLQVGLYVPRRVGAYYPELWGNVSSQYTPSSDYTALNNMLSSTYGALGNQSEIYYIPTYAVQSISGGNYEKKVIDFDEGDVLSFGLDSVHLGISAIKSIAYQLLSWLYWTV